MDGKLNERIGRLAKISETTGKGVERISITEPFVCDERDDGFCAVARGWKEHLCVIMSCQQLSR